MASALEGLPEELLDLILDAVDDLASIDVRTRYNERVRVFSSLSRTCRVLHHAAAPYLYRSFESLKDGGGARAFATTLSERPDLARLVQVVNLIPSRAKISGPPSERQVALFMPVIRSLDVEDIGPHVERALLRGCHTAEMVVIMCLTTSMKILQVSGYDHQTTVKEERVCRHCPDMADCLHAIFSPLRLRRLGTDPDGKHAYRQLNNSFVFGIYHDAAGLDRCTLHHSIATLLQIPSMRALTCTGLGPGGVFPLNELHGNSSHVTNLRLVRVNTDSRSIRCTLWACRRLVELDISWQAMQRRGEDDDDDEDLDDGEDLNHRYLEVNMGTLKTGLDLHKDSLKYLSMTNRLNRGIAWAEQGAIGSFRDFSCLRELRIDDGMLLGSLHGPPSWSTLHAEAVFPESLRVLVVNCRAGIENLQEAARSLRQFRGPHLEAIEVNFPWRDYDIVGLPHESRLDDILARPRSEKITEWSLDFENHDEGIRLTFSCWRKGGQLESIPATLESCIRVMEVGGVEGLANLLYPREPLPSPASEVDQLRISEGGDSAAP